MALSHGLPLRTALNHPCYGHPPVSFCLKQNEVQIVFNANSFQDLFGFFTIKNWNQIYQCNIIVGHCDAGDQLQLRIMYLGCIWFGEWGKLGFENKSSIVIYMQTISMNDLCSTFVNES